MNFQKLGEVEYLNEVPKDANLFVEYGGKVKRAPAKLGGSGNALMYDALPLFIENGLQQFNTLEVPVEEARELISKIKEADSFGVTVAFSEEMTGDGSSGIVKGTFPIFLIGENVEQTEGGTTTYMDIALGATMLGDGGILFIVMAPRNTDIGMVGMLLGL